MVLGFGVNENGRLVFHYIVPGKPKRYRRYSSKAFYQFINLGRGQVVTKKQLLTNMQKLLATSKQAACWRKSLTFCRNSFNFFKFLKGRRGGIFALEYHAGIVQIRVSVLRQPVDFPGQPETRNYEQFHCARCNLSRSTVPSEKLISILPKPKGYLGEHPYQGRSILLLFQLFSFDQLLTLK